MLFCSVASLPLGIMRYATSQLPFFLEQSNHTFSHSQERLCHTTQPSLTMEPALILPCMVLGRLFREGICTCQGVQPMRQPNPLTSVYWWHEREKRRQYELRVREVEHATFTPLVMLATGGMGQAATTFYKRLASMISEKRNTQYSQTMNWIRCKLSFALLRASIMLIRGARSSRHHAASETT